MISNRKNLIVGGLFIVSSLFATSAQLLAGYVYEIESVGDTDSSGSSQMMVEGSLIKMEMAGQRNGAMIYNGETRELIIIDHQRKSYMSLNEAEIAKLAAQMNAVMAEMEEQLASMPPAQRQMMENMMKSKMPQIAEKMEISVERTGEMETVAGHKAERVEMRIGTGDRRELWVTDWSNLKGGEEVAAAMKGMASLFEDFVSSMSQGPMAGMFEGGGNNWLGKLDEMGGYPIRIREYDASGKLAAQTTLQSVEEMTIGAAAFRAPKGYKKQKMRR